MKSKQTLKIGQKYRVIKDCSDSKYNGKIVTVETILDEDCFTCRGRDYILGDEENDEILELITPKKEVNKWKYSREYLSQVYKDNGGTNVNDFIFDLLAKQSIPKKKYKEIKPFKVLFNYSNNFEAMDATMSDEFKEWVKQVTDTINLLINKL